MSGRLYHFPRSVVWFLQRARGYTVRQTYKATSVSNFRYAYALSALTYYVGIANMPHRTKYCVYCNSDGSRKLQSYAVQRARPRKTMSPSTSLHELSDLSALRKT